MIIDPISLGTSGLLAPSANGTFCPLPLTLGSSGQIVIAAAVPLVQRVFDVGGRWGPYEDDKDMIDIVQLIVASGVLDADS